MKNYKFCPICKAKLIKEEECLNCPSCGNKIYLNPTPGVSILPIRDGKVLLAKRGIQPYKGDWDVFGGFIKFGETAEDCAKREFEEESGLKAKSLTFFGTYLDRYGKDGEHTLNIYFLTESWAGKVKVKDDVSGSAWILIKNAYKVRTRLTHVIKALKDLKKWYKIRALGD